MTTICYKLFVLPNSKIVYTVSCYMYVSAKYWLEKAEVRQIVWYLS